MDVSDGGWEPGFFQGLAGLVHPTFVSSQKWSAGASQDFSCWWPWVLRAVAPGPGGVCRGFLYWSGSGVTGAVV